MIPSQQYWEHRYATGGSSGAGSRGVLCNYKSALINQLVVENNIRSALDFGCGDGEQIGQFRIKEYTGVDCSRTALELCRSRYASKSNWSFILDEGQTNFGQKRQLSLSLDVVYHLVEDDVFARYMASLFDHASEMVVIYASDWDAPGPAPHVRHRWFSDWVSTNRPSWVIVDRPQQPYPFRAGDDLNTTFAGFVIFKHRGSRP